jgi:RimJ/RimL family protein N-acetyltransferase
MTEDAGKFRTKDVLKDGTSVTVRAVHRDDRVRMVTAFRNLDRETVYSRFFAFKDALSEAELERIATLDFWHDVMLVVTVGDGDDEVVIGAGSYSVHSTAGGTSAAEVAFVVEEDYQGRGIAKRLLAHLVRLATDRGVARFEAEVLSDNHSMLRVFSRSGLPMRRHLDGGTTHVSLDLRGLVTTQ